MGRDIRCSFSSASRYEKLHMFAMGREGHHCRHCHELMEGEMFAGGTEERHLDKYLAVLK